MQYPYSVSAFHCGAHNGFCAAGFCYGGAYSVIVIVESEIFSPQTFKFLYTHIAYYKLIGLRLREYKLPSVSYSPYVAVIVGIESECLTAVKYLGDIAAGQTGYFEIGSALRGYDVHLLLLTLLLLAKVPFLKIALYGQLPKTEREESYLSIVNMPRSLMTDRNERISKMAETIYTIPVNEAFDACAADDVCECPLCRLYDKFENDELELILGASMMEPDIRIKTNEQGFCRTHYDMMLERKNRLGMALMLQSHLDELSGGFSGGAGDLVRGIGATLSSRLGTLESSCYVCGRTEHSFGKALENVLYLWESDAEFRKKLSAQNMFCLPHFRILTELARKRLAKKKFSEFYRCVKEVTDRYLKELRGDIDLFCRKFDYRYQDEPWGNAKDSVERAVKFLEGDIHRQR